MRLHDCNHAAEQQKSSETAAEIDAVQDVDGDDVGDQRQEQRGTEKTGSRNNQQNASSDLDDRDRGSVEPRIAEVVPRQPEAADASQRFAELRIEHCELRAVDFGKPI